MRHLETALLYCSNSAGSELYTPILLINNQNGIKIDWKTSPKPHTDHAVKRSWKSLENNLGPKPG